MSGSKQRRFPRYPIYLPVSHRPAASARWGTGVGWTRNLSEGGICLELGDRLKPAMPLRLRLRTDQGAIEAEGQVMWVHGTPPGTVGAPHGIAFTRMAPDHQRALGDLVYRKGELLPVSLRVPVKLSAHCRCKGGADPPLEGWTGNISQGGVLLHLPRAFPQGTEVELTLHGSQGPLELGAAVIWLDPPERRKPGQAINHGLQFTKLGWPALQSLGSVLVLTE
jgi:c-di-GMP-binding flagellar brake protein YcgR